MGNPRSETFSSWLLRELGERGWQQVDLARYGELKPTQISRVVNDMRNPGPDFCTGVARAFRLPPELVFRRAGLLPPKASVDPRFEELAYQMAYLSEDQQDMLMTLVRTLAAEHIRQIQVDVPLPVNTHTDTDND